MEQKGKEINQPVTKATELSDDTNLNRTEQNQVLKAGSALYSQTYTKSFSLR